MSKTFHYASRKQAETAYPTGYAKGKSDAVKQQYWLESLSENSTGAVFGRKAGRQGATKENTHYP